MKYKTRKTDNQVTVYCTENGETRIRLWETKENKENGVLGYRKHFKVILPNYIRSVANKDLVNRLEKEKPDLWPATLRELAQDYSNKTGQLLPGTWSQSITKTYGTMKAFFRKRGHGTCSLFL